ncbi:oligosaccharide flippase family protein [Falsiporphyromonas endometrii]|uniref:Oligosaccharide flippase family protein n=1 Tax=Falsiporphyromonas endometrii TaxID=1387297 RepID=A0ABV9K9T1_9PORP
MPGSIKSLVKDTAVYGLSSIAGRFLNWLLVPMYTNVLVHTSDYGIVTNLYAWTALLIIILTYGMETGFFRFINKDSDPRSVYSTTLWSLGSTSVLFVVLGLTFLTPISELLNYPEQRDCIGMLIVVVAMDAFMAIPFAYLRYAQRPWRFAILKFLFIFLNISLNLFFLILCPWLMKVAPSTVEWFYRPEDQVKYIFLSNLLADIILFICILPYCRTGFKFRGDLLKKMLNYSYPILILGIAGNFNKVADKILFPLVYPNAHEAASELGIYGACFKIAVVMVMFTQAFRYAYEPFIFNKKKGEDANDRMVYAAAMKYYIIFGFFIFLGVMGYIDIIKFFAGKAYHGALVVVPWVMMGEFMFGIYFNISLWYKLTDRTYWGAVFSIMGCVMTVVIIILGVPKYSYMACAWASAISNGVMMITSYLLGKKYYKVPYDLKNAFFYLVLAALCFGMILGVKQFLPHRPVLGMVINTVPIFIYLFVFIKKDLDKAMIPSKVRSLLRIK